MRLAYVNPNSTRSMTEEMVAVARRAVPGVEVLGWTNHAGPAAIQGAEDGERAVPGVLAMLPEIRAAGAEALVIGCFDDTGLAEIRAVAGMPVIGIGQAAFHMAALIGLPWSVVTTLAVSLPVIEGNIAGYGLGGGCRSVRASGVAVLELERPTGAVMERLSGAISRTVEEDGSAAVVLGCAGMASLAAGLQARHGVRMIDGVAASAVLATAVAGYGATVAVD